MTKVITYGTYDLLHRGHVRLLERAKALGDHLIVGVTSDDYDKTRGKINAAQSLIERIEAVKATGLADEIIVEEYEGQKIDDIRRLGADIFTVGDDWKGKFDYLQEYCHVVYLPRTEGVSSTEIRSDRRLVRLGIVGAGRVPDKYRAECEYVNGLSFVAQCSDDCYSRLLDQVDAVFVYSHPSRHVELVRKALLAGKHVLCESPIALTKQEYQSLVDLAAEKNLVLMDAIKTAYSTAYRRMLLLIKSGKIGRVISVDATSTSLMPPYSSVDELNSRWNTRCEWAPTGLLTVFQILGCDYKRYHESSFYACGARDFDIFSKFDFEYQDAVASVKVGKGVKSEGDLVISGTQGYIYVPSPWWKTDYFEVRFENPAENRRYFYQLDGEGIRYELVAFTKAISCGGDYSAISREVSSRICDLMTPKKEYDE